MGVRRSNKTNARFAALLMVFSAPVHSADDELFERPDSLKPAIRFWTKVYSEVDSLAGYVHDSSHLGVVYDTLRFNWYDSAQVQDRQIEAAVQYYRSALLELAKGKRDKLSAHEKKVLALWGPQVSRATLRAAADRLRFQRGQSDRIRDGIIRAGAWENGIRKTLRDAGLPEDLAALPHVESSYNPQAQSHAGAVGLWQFTDYTGRHYLRVDNVVDERVDPVRATDGAVRLLQRYYSKLHSWPLTITAYNHGLSGVRRAVRETGSTDIGVIARDYSGPRFGFASRNYYAAFLAARDVTRHAERHFGQLDRAPAGDYWTVKAPRYLQVDDLVQQLALDAEDIRALNPALQPAVWSGKKYVPRDYPLRLPATTDTKTITALLTRVQGYARQVPDLFYRVKEGDTLSAIAQRHNHSVRDLMALNDLRSENRILAGQSLRISSAALPVALPFAAMEPIEKDGDRLLMHASETSFDAVAATP